MSWLLESAIAMKTSVDCVRFEARTRDPARRQAQVLRRLLSSNAGTAFGRTHDFSRISNAEDYARAIPVAGYEEFRPFVQRVIDGERRVLTAEQPCMFTCTSGTTGEPKLIPVTATAKDLAARAIRVWLARAMQQHSGCLSHKALTMVSPVVEGTTATRIPYGSMSGLSSGHVPEIIRRHYALPAALSLVEDYSARYSLAMRLAMAQRVSMIATANPGTLIRLAETAKDNAEQLVRAVRDGTLGIGEPRIHVTPGVTSCDVLREIRAATYPDRARARFLEDVILRTGGLSPRDVWPELRLIGCWLGGSAGFQAAQLRKHYGGVPRRDLGLWASEGRMTIPVSDETASGVLALDTNFYEFIPERGIDELQPRTLLAHQLERGQRYYLIISSDNGLYRYEMNDIVEVTGFYNRTPMLAFVRKGRDMVSICGEKLHLNHIQTAVRCAEQQTKVAIRQFRIIPDLTHLRYHLLVEQVANSGLIDAAGFTEAFDRSLSVSNIEYASRRAAARLHAPIVWVMQHGWSERVAGADFKSGKRETQYKWQHITHEWDPISAGEVARFMDVTSGRGFEVRGRGTDLPILPPTSAPSGACR